MECAFKKLSVAKFGGSLLDVEGKGIPKIFGKMTVVFGSPIEWKEVGDKKDNQVRITNQTGKAIRDLKAWLDKGANGVPP